jgi:anti-sigma factor RsiW
MATGADNSKPTDRELAELSALADGTLEPSRRAQVEARIAASPELSAAYERERRLLVAIAHARSTDRAPAALRARVEAERPSPRTAARRRIVYGGGFAGALAAIALALVLLLPSGTPGAPSVSEAAALAVRGADQSAPGPDPSNPTTRLDENVGEVYFPNWATSRLHWRAVGERVDRLKGRTAVTVFYEWGKARIAYTIVGTPTLTGLTAPETSVDGTAVRTLTLNGRLIVTWRRAGAACVLSGSGVKASELQMLAAWRVPADH